MKQEFPPYFKLDIKDRKILYELDLNGRQPYSQLAKRVRLTKEGVAYRVQRLQQKGIIKSFNAVIDSSKLGYIGEALMTKFKNCSPEQEDEIINYLNEQKHVWWVNSRGGEYNIGFAWWVRDIRDGYDFQAKFLAKFRANILKILPRVYRTIHQYPRSYLLEKPPTNTQSILLLRGQTQKYDDNDLSILRILSTNARTTIPKISEIVKLTPAIVRYRIKQLEEKKIILGYRAVVDIQKIGYYWYKINLYLNDFSKRNQILEFAREHPNIIYAYDAIGAADIELELEVKGEGELLAIADSLREQFTEIIEYYEYYLWTKEHKLVYMPEV